MRQPILIGRITAALSETARANQHFRDAASRFTNGLTNDYMPPGAIWAFEKVAAVHTFKKLQPA